MKNNFKITTLDSLKAFKKANRDNIVPLKSNVFIDNKKKINKFKCREKDNDEIL